MSATVAMRARRPARLLHRGTVRAAALLVDPALCGEAEARRRVLALWAPGAKLHQAGDAYLLLLARPLWLRAERAPGLVLIEAEGVLRALAAPFEAAPGAVVRASAGVVQALPPGQRVDASAWIDVDDFVRVVARSLGEPAAPPPTPPSPRPAARAILGAPAAAAEREALIEELRRAGAAAETSAPAPAPAGLWSRLRAALARWLGPARPALPAASGGRPVPARASAPPAAPGWLARLRARLAEALWRSRLGAALGRRHAEYLDRMLGYFKDGRLDEALRHAIPLGDVGRLGEPGRLPLAPPRPRASLEITDRRGDGSSLPLGDELHERVRDVYRRAFEQLARAGQIEQAAFVLAELLGDSEEAVAFLVQHDRLRAAAELAETRELPAGLAVRLWFLAGDRARALRLARLRHAFADAMSRLERSGPEAEALAFRQLWAETLAEAGDLAGAVEAVWTAPRLRPLARSWLDALIDAGGVAGARALVRALALGARPFTEVRARVLELTADASPEGAPVREALARALHESASFEEARTLARPALRAWVRDAGLGLSSPRTQELDALCVAAGEPTLGADRPPLPPPPRKATLPTLAPPRTHTFSGDDRGELGVHDAALLPDGRLLLALGEVGVRLYRPDGRLQATIDVPAHALAVADHGGQAMAIARRGACAVIARLDLHARRARRFGELGLDAWAPTHDGHVWFVAAGGSVHALDDAAASPESLWSSATRGQVKRLARGAGWLAATLVEPGELWSWSLPDQVLRARTPCPDGADVLAVDAGRAIVAERSEGGLVLRDLHAGGRSTLPQLGQGPSLGLGLLAGNADWLVAHGMGDPDLWTPPTLLVVADRVTLRPRLQLGLHDAGDSCARLCGHHLVVGDRAGRVLVIELLHGRIVRSLRVRAGR